MVLTFAPGLAASKAPMSSLRAGSRLAAAATVSVRGAATAAAAAAATTRDGAPCSSAPRARLAAMCNFSLTLLSSMFLMIP